MALQQTTLYGAVNDQGDDRALYLKQFAGETFAAWKQATHLWDRVMKKRVSGQKSSQFIAYGRAEAGFRVRGQSILTETHGGVALNKAFNIVERNVNLDDQMLVLTVIDEMDDMLSHYDTRSGFAEELGQALARKYDTYAQLALLNAARTTIANSAAFIPADLGTLGEGSYVQTASGTAFSAATDAVGLDVLNTLHEAAAVMDTKNVPRNPRYCLLPPLAYWAVVSNAKILNRDFGNNQGVMFRGEVPMVAGFILIESNHFPTTGTEVHDGSDTVGNAATTDRGGGNPAGAKNDYRILEGSVTGLQGDGTAIVNNTPSVLQALCWHPRAVGTLFSQTATIQVDRQNVEYQGDIIVAKMMAGTTRLRPECALEIGTAAAQPALCFGYTG